MQLLCKSKPIALQIVKICLRRELSLEHFCASRTYCVSELRERAAADGGLRNGPRHRARGYDIEGKGDSGSDGGSRVDEMLHAAAGRIGWLAGSWPPCDKPSARLPHAAVAGRTRAPWKHHS